MNVLGLNLTTTATGLGLDDGACALFRDGLPVVAVAEERIVREKHAGGVAQSAQYCLEAAGLSIGEVDRVAVSICCDAPPTPDEAVAQLRSQGLDVQPDRVLVCPSHHLSHAASAFLCSPFDAAIAVVADNEGSILGRRANSGSAYWEHPLERTSVWRCDSRRSNRIELLSSHGNRADELHLGAAYNYFTKWLGLNSYHEAGQTMALAGFERSRLAGGRVFWWQGDRLVCSVRPRHGDKAGAVREWSLRELGSDIGAGRSACWEPSELQMEVAWVIQSELEAALLELVGRAVDQTGIGNDRLAGGVALNCVANARLAREVGLGGVFVQPAASDVGQCLGNALWAYHCALGQPRSWLMRSAALGRVYGPEEIVTALKPYDDRLTARKSRDPAREAAGLIAEGNIIGWFQGASEFGPRALGHRSILGDPRHQATKTRLDAEIKHRQPFRPYAPSVPADAAREWFDVTENELAGAGSPLDFMLLAVLARPDRRQQLPSVVHVDGSSRLHVVHKGMEPRFHALLQEMERLTGVPVVLNTSFNPAGEPIVETPDHALDAFLAMGLDRLILEEWIVSRRAPHPYDEE